MGSPATMNPHTVWNERKRTQALRAATACATAALDVTERVYITFEGVALVEHGAEQDVGSLRLQPDGLVFAGPNETRVIPWGTIVLLGSVPGVSSCIVNSTEYLTTCTFRCDYPLEYHIGAWYSRWLESAPFTEVDPSGTVSLPLTH